MNIYKTSATRVGAGTVYSVDDGWFDSSGEKYSVDLALGYSLSKNLDIVAILAKLSTAKDSQSPPREMLPREMLHLLQLLIAQRNDLGFDLALCDFEYFEKWFDSELNRPRTAILLDVWNLSAAPSEREYYGVDRLHALLHGRRPYADICFLTRHEEVERRLTGRRREAGGWLLGTIPTVLKEDLPSEEGDELDALARDLDAFLRYFDQGRNKNPTGQMARALFELSPAQRHPSTLQDGSGTIISGLPVPLSNLYSGDAGYQSFKALYHYYDPSALESVEDPWKPRYRVETEVFAEHLRYFTGRLVSVDAGSTLLLPCMPGCVFLLLLTQFVLDLKSLDVERPIRITEVGESGGLCSLPLTSSASACIECALLGPKSGNSTMLLRQLLVCDSKPIARLAGFAGQAHSPWRERPSMEGCSSDERPLMLRPLFQKDRLDLCW